jgi:chemotaxis protein CheD
VTSATEVMVRMGELVATRDQSDTLLAIGLGSCIGLAMLDRKLPIVGLAHVMLPESPAGGTDTPGKFADTAVPALRERMVELGASPSRIDAVLVGGAQMFSFGKTEGSRLDVGARNEQAVRESLAAARIKVIATATAGKTGRTMRVTISPAGIIVKEAGQPATELFTR